MITTDHRNNAELELDRAQQRLSTLLLAEPRDLPAIVEAADVVRRLEHAALRAKQEQRK